MSKSEIVAFDLEGTLTAGIAWEGMRDYLLVHNQGDKYRRFFRRNFLPVLAYRLGLLRDERAFKEGWVLGVMRLFAGFSAAQMEEMAGWWWPTAIPFAMCRCCGWQKRPWPFIPISCCARLLCERAGEFWQPEFNRPESMIDKDP